MCLELDTDFSIPFSMLCLHRLSTSIPLRCILWWKILTIRRAAIFGATAPGGSIVGAVFAALFALGWWPWAFWSFAITLAAIAVVAVFAIPDPPKKIEVSRMSLREKLISLDIAGATLGITALVLVNFAWNQAGIVGWTQAYVYVCLILGALFAAGFFYVEMRLASEPLIPFEALSSEVAFVLGCVAFGWASFGIWGKLLLATTGCARLTKS